MKKITTNVKQLKPHIRWILKQMRLKDYNVLVAFLRVKDCKKHGIIPKEAKGWTGVFMPPNMVWVSASAVRRGPRWLMNVLSHELRHYYQAKTKKFPMKESSTPDDQTKMTKKEKAKYLGDPREKDAIAFQLRLMDKLERDPKTQRRLRV